MPTCLSLQLLRCKACKLSAFFILFPLFFSGQSLTGLWTGVLNNDSTTIRKEQSFEIVLTEYRGKVYGYSRSEFIVDDTLYFMVKRVKGSIDGDVCEVIDDEIISYNFRGKLDKGIKVTSTFRRNRSDSAWYLAGTWKTNATKKYYAVTGKVELSEEKDLTASKIFPHLEELNLTKDIAFYQERKEETHVARMVKPESARTLYSNKDIAVKSATAQVGDKPAFASQKPLTVNETVTGKEEISTAIINEKQDSESSSVVIEKDNIVSIPVDKPVEHTASIKMPEQKQTPRPAIRTEQKQLPIPKEEEKIPGVTVKESVQKVDPVYTDVASTRTGADVARKTPGNTKNTQEKTTGQSTEKSTASKKQNELTKATASTKPVAKKEITPMEAVISAPQIVRKENTSVSEATAISPKTTTIDITSLASSIGGRKTEFSQIVSYKTDSLQLSLYDNGQIDGDTVSIYLNGNVIMSEQVLKASAIKKTIYIGSEQEDFTLVLFAENLGQYPPNTGLLVVRDGEDVYNLRFSSDFQKNAGIVFRRKR